MRKGLTEYLANRIRTLSSPLNPIPTEAKPRLQHMPGVRAVLFDVYGTLFISAAGDIDAGQACDGSSSLSEALKSIGAEGQIEQAAQAGGELLTQFICEEHERKKANGTEYPEVNIKTIWEKVLHELGKRGLLKCEISDDDLETLAVEYECRVNPVWPMPGLCETLSSLWQHAFLLGIVSNAQFFTPLLFDAFLGEGLEPVGFQSELCTWSWKLLEAKPSTDLLRGPVNTLQAEYGVSPDQVLYVGNDVLNDIWPAKKLGCRTALFAGDKRSLRLREDDERCNDVRPTAIITHLAQLADILPVARQHRPSDSAS